MQRYIVVIEGSNLNDLEEKELIGLPREGEPIETKFGTCIVVSTEQTADGGVYSGRIVCRYPA
jgi:hypothetical protein